MKYASEKFKTLPAEVQQKYKDEFARSSVEYREKLEEFHKKHPYMRKPQSTRENSLFFKKPSNKKPVTPLTLFRNELTKDGSEVSMLVAQQMYRLLPDDQRAKYIEEALKMETTQDVHVSKKDRDFLSRLARAPEPPGRSLFSFFKKTYKKSLIQSKMFFQSTFADEVIKAWSALSEQRLVKLEKEYESAILAWRTEIVAYIKKQPVDEQPELYAKWKPYAPMVKRSATIKSEDQEPPRKRRKSVYEEQFILIEPSTSAVKDKKSTPKEPDYPSQFTAHYFMTKIYDGKPTKVAKAYKLLDALEKKKYKEETKDRKKTFLVAVGSYIKQLAPADVIAYQMKMKAYKAKQQDEISWHVSSGTDDEQKTAVNSESSADESSDNE